MAYINVAEWSPDQVTDWIKGLDDSMYNYVYSFINNGVGGHQLLNIRPYELEQLGMNSIGHQEIVLEAVENLRNFHYNLDKENLQCMALHVATAARSLHRLLALKTGCSMIETQILNDITRTIARIKPLISWLDRSPFQGQFQFTEICRKMLRLGLEMATIAQRERFVENPVEQIRTTAETLERLANYIIQDITDPMLLQPASLNLVTLKKRESELGFNIETSYHGIHRVTDIKHNSPAHNSGKIEDGDEIVQINYQTVVGWQYKTVLLQLRESLPDVLLTLKKRPKHTKIYGQIYMQPYRLPSKKRNVSSRWGENIPSPRSGFLSVPDNTFKLPILLNADNAKTDDGDTDSICSDILTPTDIKAVEKESRLYYPKPRAMLQRRNTICGDELLGHKSVVGVPLWHDHKAGNGGDPSSPSLRDKSVSFGFGLEITARPTTCIGIGGNSGGNGKFSSDKAGVAQFGDAIKLRQVVEQPNEEQEISSKPGVCKVVRFDANMKVEDYTVDEKYTCNVQNTILETFEPIPFADEEDEEDVLEALQKIMSKKEQTVKSRQNILSSSNNVPIVETINVPTFVRRGRLDKSHSTPAYDNSGEESDTPPAIEPRKDFLLITPPVPPPRPKKLGDTTFNFVPVPPPKPPGLLAAITAAAATSSNANIQSVQISNLALPIQTEQESKIEEDDKSFLSCTSIVSLPTTLDTASEVSGELHTPTKTRSLTLKKKHSLISKRRNVNLKMLGTGDIQGFLYRRTKDKRGVTFWARLYFVMLDTILYGFRSKEATKASCVIFLPGFTVSLAKEVHSKPYAFKVYHAAKTFYFATESLDALNQWVEFIRQSTLSISVSVAGNSVFLNEISSKDLFSENESSSEENEATVTKNLCTPSPQGSREIQQVLIASKASTTTPMSTKSDRRYLGSLRKLTKGTLPFKSSNASDKKHSNDIPVPTDQFRSYRKVPGGSFGIQIGANTPGYHDTSLHPFNSTNNSVLKITPEEVKIQHSYQPQRKPQGCSNAITPSEIVIYPPQPTQQNNNQRLRHSSSRTSIASNTDSTITGLEAPASPAPIPDMPIKMSTSPSSTSTSTINCVPQSRVRDECTVAQQANLTSPSKSVKKISFNYIHASNPNLVEFDFQTSRTLDYNLPKINSSNAWEAVPNIQGFVTLKDLMLQKQEEEAQEMYNNRVLLGVEKKEEHRRQAAYKQATQTRQLIDSNQRSVNITSDAKVSKTQSRSLPKPPDYEISFKPDDEDIQLTRTKEGLKLRDFGYELISGDEPVGGCGSSFSSSNSKNRLLASRQISNHSTSSAEHLEASSSIHGSNWAAAMKSRPFLLTSGRNKKHSTSSSCSAADYATNGSEKRLGSFKKKGKLESFKTSSERIFQFGKHSAGNAAGITMTLPLNKKSNFHNAIETAITGSISGIKKSQTYNNDLKEKADKYDAQRKNSAPMPIFSKLSFSSSSSSASSNNFNIKTENKKEKKHSNSPLFHRTVFGHHNQAHNQQIASIPSTPTNNSCMGRDYDQEIFAQVIIPNQPPNYRKHSITSSLSNNAIISAPDTTAPPPPIKSSNANVIDFTVTSPSNNSITATTEYPNMECPPVFEPDIYSLTDPKASLFLRRNNNNNAKSSNITSNNKSQSSESEMN